MHHLAKNPLHGVRFISAVCLSAVALNACSGDCLAIGAPSIIMTIVDAATGVAPTSAPTVRMSDGTNEETRSAIGVGVPPQPTVPVFYSTSLRAGVFLVTVTAEGYQTFVREGIRVTADQCGLATTARITARLQPTVAP